MEIFPVSAKVGLIESNMILPWPREQESASPAVTLGSQYDSVLSQYDFLCPSNSLQKTVFGIWKLGNEKTHGIWCGNLLCLV